MEAVLALLLCYNDFHHVVIQGWLNISMRYSWVNIVEKKINIEQIVTEQAFDWL